jgi:hypothetical protein
MPRVPRINHTAYLASVASVDAPVRASDVPKNAFARLVYYDSLKPHIVHPLFKDLGQAPSQEKILAAATELPEAFTYMECQWWQRIIGDNIGRLRRMTVAERVAAINEALAINIIRARMVCALAAGASGWVTNLYNKWTTGMKLPETQLAGDVYVNDLFDWAEDCLDSGEAIISMGEAVYRHTPPAKRAALVTRLEDEADAALSALCGARAAIVASIEENCTGDECDYETDPESECEFA